MPVFEVVEGWTGPLDFTLKANGVAVDLTGMTVIFILKDKDGAAIDTSGNASVVTPAAGLVSYSPDAGDLVAAKTPHSARWRVTDGGGKVVFFPHGAPDRWQVFVP
jgi:hypothetical protein